MIYFATMIFVLISFYLLLYIIMGKETLTTKRKLEILKEFWEYWKEMAQYYKPERIEAAVLLWLYDTLMEEEWIEEWTKEQLVDMFMEIFTPEYIDELWETRCESKQDLELLQQWIWFAWGLLSEDESIYEAIDNTKHIMELTKMKVNKEDLEVLFRIIYWEIEEENDEEEKKKVMEEIKKIRG